MTFINKILEECSVYYRTNILELRNYLTSSFLCEIALSNDSHNVLHPSNRNIKYIKGSKTICYRVDFPEYSNYNLHVILHIQPSTNELLDISISIKTYKFSINSTLCNIVFSKHDEGYRGVVPTKVISSAKVHKLAKVCCCPYANPMILPFFYVRQFNELDSYVTELSLAKRKPKYR